MELEKEPQRRMLSVEEVANALTVGTPTVRSLINRGLLPVQRRGDQDYVLYEDVLAFLRDDQQRLLLDGAQPADYGLTSAADSEAMQP